MGIIEIQRLYRDDCTLGILTYEDFRCFTLELPDLDNAPGISCIPEGTYTGRLHTSPKNGRVISIDNVPDRSFIQIHKGNYTRQIEGCILVGDSIKFLNDDGIPDVTNSTRTLNHLIRIIPPTVKIAIF